MSRASWQSRRPVYGKFSHVIDLTLKHRNSMQQHLAKKTKNYNCFQVLAFKNLRLVHHFPWTSYALWRFNPFTPETGVTELIPSRHDMTWYDFIYSNILRLGYEQRTKPITSAKRRGWNGHRFLCVPHRSWGFNVCNKIRRTCVSRVIVFCVTPIVPESFMMVSSINVLV